MDAALALATSCPVPGYVCGNGCDDFPRAVFPRTALLYIACPYGRFQSVMLDRKKASLSLNDFQRGEPREEEREPLQPNKTMLLATDR